MNRTVGLIELALIFLRLGATSFGGPAAHIAMMEDEFVKRRRWLSSPEFLDLIAATNLIPGPNSTELAIHIGYRQAGWAGLVVAGVSFIAPAMLIVMALGWFYLAYGTIPITSALLYGIKPVVIAVLIQAIWRLGRSAVKNYWLALVGLSALLGRYLGLSEIQLLIIAGALAAAMFPQRIGKQLAAAPLIPISLSVPLVNTAFATGTAPSLAPGLSALFFVFLKIGSVLFGSGYVLIAFLEADLVRELGWIDDRLLLDAVAVGQITPGPVFTTATFIGFILLGWSGAVVATIGIFLPAFLFVALTAPFIHRLRGSEILGRALDGLNVASLALMLYVTWQLLGDAVIDSTTAAIALGAVIGLISGKISPSWLVVIGGFIGAISLR